MGWILVGVFMAGWSLGVGVTIVAIEYMESGKITLAGPWQFLMCATLLTVVSFMFQ